MYFDSVSLLFHLLLWSFVICSNLLYFTPPPGAGLTLLKADEIGEKRSKMQPAHDCVDISPRAAMKALLPYLLSGSRNKGECEEAKGG